jgi:hypothetical protein
MIDGMDRRKFLMVAGWGMGASPRPAPVRAAGPKATPHRRVRAPQLGEIVFCEKRPYGMVVCGSKATLLVGAGGWQLFGPEVGE